MKPRRKHIYVIIIGVGLAAVVVDRIIGTGWTGQPDPAAASAVPERTMAVPADAANVAAVLAAAPFPRRLPAAPSPHLQRDLFAIPPSAMEALGVVVPGSDVAAGSGQGSRVQGVSRAEEFAADHELSAILFDGERYLVVVNGDVLEIGQGIDGCTLNAVDERGVIFECGDGAARLEIASEFDMDGS